MATQTITTPTPTPLPDKTDSTPGSPTRAAVARDEVEAPGSPARAVVARDGVADVITFLSRYLYCTEHERTLIALWILHTHCFSAAEVTPYLSIQSATEQSGKTLTLQLLSLLCPNPALTANFATSALSNRIHYSEHRPTFLLDECHATIGSRNRSKNPILRAILTSGFHRGLGHTDRKGERVIFSPKAFAGIGPLPHALAERSIPIHLEPLNASVHLREFRSEQAEAEAQPLREWLAEWGKENLQKLKSAPTLELKEYPAGIPLTPRHQDLLKPLLQIAKVLDKEWPRRVTTALTQVFKDHLNRERKHLLALLFELREAFSHYGQPERLSTASLLAWLHHDPDASWNQEGPINADRLANMLRPFDIYPGLKHKKKGEQSSHRGYTLQSFLYTWNTLLPPEPAMNRNTSRREPMPDPPRSTQTNEVADPGVPRTTVRAALNTANANATSIEDRVAQHAEPQIKIGAERSRPQPAAGLESATKAVGVAPISPNNDAGGNNVTTTREVSPSGSKSNAETASSTGRPNIPGLVPNPQPIPFPSKAELERQGYRFGPFTPQHNPLDVEMITHYAKQGYRPLEPHEVDYAEFRRNGVPFARAASVPYRPQASEPPKPQKDPEELAKEEMTAWLRKQQQSLPKCAEHENVRLAPTKRRQ